MWSAALEGTVGRSELRAMLHPNFAEFPFQKLSDNSK
jgi:hypothetical protein